MAALAVTVAGLAAAALSAAQPIQSGQGPFTPLGNALTSDKSGPFDVTLLPTQAAEVGGGAMAREYKGGVTDADVVDFLVNVECLEGLFDTWGTFGRGFIGDLELGGPTPKGARQANLTEETQLYLREVALNEQGHALMTRHAGGKNPCPAIDFDKGFNDILAAAYELDGTVESVYGAPFDPFKNDVNFVMSVLTLEELGATGNKGLAGLVVNPVLANAIAGLATSACMQSTIERFVLYGLRDEIVEPFGETGQEVFARISAWRNMMTAPYIMDQGIINTDPRFIAVPGGVNLSPTDIHGLTFNRSPQQVINIVTIGAADGVGGFFPEGLLGKINTPEGWNVSGDPLLEWPSSFEVAVQQTKDQAGGEIPPGIAAATEPPIADVPGVYQLTQALDGDKISKTAAGRGFQDVDMDPDNFNTDGRPVEVPDNSGSVSPAYGTCRTTTAMGRRRRSMGMEIRKDKMDKKDKKVKGDKEDEDM